MAFCPNCDAVIGAAERKCPECEYDFPLPPDFRRERFAYSKIANISLLIGAWAAGLGCAAVTVSSVVALFHGDACGGLVVGPLTFFVLLGMLVVFLRVQDLDSRK
jgi:hypothetical protein